MKTPTRDPADYSVPQTTAAVRAAAEEKYPVGSLVSKMSLVSVSRNFAVTSGDLLRKQLSRNLRNIRATRRMSQGELAAAAGLDRVTIARIEGERLSVRLETLGRIADALGVSPTDLLRAPKSENNGDRRPARQAKKHSTEGGWQIYMLRWCS